MSETTVTKTREWDDRPEEGRTVDDWPYPNHYVEFLVTGKLADRTRKAFGVTHDQPVYLTEVRVSSGYSEWTKEDDFEFWVECGERKIKFSNGIDNYTKTTVARFSEWLDKHDD